MAANRSAEQNAAKKSGGQARNVRAASDCDHDFDDAKQQNARLFDIVNNDDRRRKFKGRFKRSDSLSSISNVESDPRDERSSRQSDGFIDNLSDSLASVSSSEREEPKGRFRPHQPSHGFSRYRNESPKAPNNAAKFRSNSYRSHSGDHIRSHSYNRQYENNVRKMPFSYSSVYSLSPYSSAHYNNSEQSTKDDLALVSLSTNSDRLSTPPQGSAGVYPSKNRQALKLPPLSKRLL